MGAIVEYHKPGDSLTFTVGATAVTGGNLVAASDDRTVIPTGDDSVTCVGVALYDGSEDDKIAVAAEGVWPLTTVASTGAVTQGQRVKAMASGRIAPIDFVGGDTADQVVGYALEDIAAGATGRVKLTL